jgi:hypothetical protein
MVAPYECDYWLACAGKAYARSEGIDDPRARQIMLRVAKGYECLALRERKRAEFLTLIKKNFEISRHLGRMELLGA